MIVRKARGICLEIAGLGQFFGEEKSSFGCGNFWPTQTELSGFFSFFPDLLLTKAKAKEFKSFFLKNNEKLFDNFLGERLAK